MAKMVATGGFMRGLRACERLRSAPGPPTAVGPGATRASDGRVFVRSFVSEGKDALHRRPRAGPRARETGRQAVLARPARAGPGARAAACSGRAHPRPAGLAPAL